MQSWEWGEFKAALGWRVERVVLEREGKIVAGAQVLLRSLPWLPFNIAYIPKGPVADLTDREAIGQLLTAVHQAARRYRAIFLRIEPSAIDDDSVHNVLRDSGFQSTAQTNQPRSTLVLDLTGGEPALWANMRRTTKKLIRRARRDGVEIVEGDTRDLDAFYQTIAATSETKGFPIHDKEFYEQAWHTFKATDSVKLMLARYQGQVVAAKMIVVYGDKSMHLWGGTRRRGRDTRASYLLQWESIKWAMNRGCRCCDLWGIPDQVGELLQTGQELPQDQRGGLWGVYNFKRGFGGEIEYYVGAYDYAYKSLLYRLGRMLLARQSTLDVASHWLERLSGRTPSG